VVTDVSEERYFDFRVEMMVITEQNYTALQSRKSQSPLVASC
jgi:hypothetical protein